MRVSVTDADELEGDDITAESVTLVETFARRLGLAIATAAAVVGVTIFLTGPRNNSGDDALMLATLPDADAAVGRQLYAASCASCHGSGGEGMPQQGVPLRGSAFVSRSSEVALARFLAHGRSADDRDSLTRRAMPPKGGNAKLSQQDLGDIARFLRSMQSVAHAD